MTSSEDPTRVQPTVPAPPGGGGRLEPRDPAGGGPWGPDPGGPGGPGSGEPPLPPTGGGGDDGDDDPGKRTNPVFLVIAGALVLIALFLGLSVLGGDDDDGRVASGDDTPAQTESQDTPPADDAAPTADDDAGAADDGNTGDDAPAQEDDSAADDTGGNSGSAGNSGGVGVGSGDEQGGDATLPELGTGGVTKLTAVQGSTVRFEVQSDAAQEVHVHGYDLKYDLQAGETRTISFDASLTGIFEIEFEGTGEQIGELTVEP